MKHVLIATTAALGLLAAVPASAQSTSTTVTTTTAPSATGAITIAPEKRTVIRQRLTSKPVTLKERVTVGMTVPTEVELVEVPETVVTEVPTVKSYRYFRWNDDVVLVDPSSRRVVHILD